MRRVFACAAAATLCACLFPSLDGLAGAPDATADGAVVDAMSADVSSDAGADVTADAGMCPPNDDTSLVAYYTFDEGSGSIAHDCSGHGYDALLSGTNAANAWTAGHVNGGIAFASANQTCVIVASASANQTSTFTAAAWFEMAPASGGGYLVGQRRESGYAWRIDIEPNTSGNDLGFAIGANDDAGNDFSADTLTDTGVFHHFAAVYDPSGPTQTLYFDGVVVDTKPSAAAITLDPIASTIRIGCRGDDTNYFDGVIDEVRVYSRALAASEIAALAKQ